MQKYFKCKSDHENNTNMEYLNKGPLDSCYSHILTILYIVGLTGFIKVMHTYLYNTRAANHNGV